MIRITYRQRQNQLHTKAIEARLVIDEYNSYSCGSAYIIPGQDNTQYCREFVAKWEGHAAKLGLEFEIDGESRLLLMDPVAMGGQPTKLVILEN